MDKTKETTELKESVVPDYRDVPQTIEGAATKDYAIVFESLPVPTIILDLDGVIQGVNREFLLVSGYLREELVGKKMSDISICPQAEKENRPSHLAINRYIINALQVGTKVAEIDLDCKMKPGGSERFTFLGQAISDAQGNIVGVVNVGIDKSESRNLSKALSAAEKTIQSHSSSLEKQITDRLEENRQRTRILEELSVTDELTKLYNRRYLFTRLKEEIHRSQRYATPFSVVLLDIDYFKQINDTYGHQAGDMVLYELAGLLRGSVRPMDIVARFGGEEFMILLPSITADYAYLFCERLRKKAEAFQYTYLPKGKFVTVSMGVADFPNENAENSDELVKIVDKALYKAKETRNATIIADSK